MTDIRQVSTSSWIERALSAASSAAWRIDPERRQIEWSAGSEEVSGGFSGPVGLEEWLGSVHEEDRERVRQTLDQALAEGRLRIQYRLGGDVEKWVLAVGRTEDGVLSGAAFDGGATKQLEADVQAANRELEGFTYTVSHDLRGPLRAIMASSMILIEDYDEKLDDEGRQELRRQADAAKRMSQFLDHLLALSRLGRGEIGQEPIDVTALANEIAAELNGKESRHPVRFEVAPGLTTVGDPKLVRQLLSHLLENAARFGKPEGVEVRVYHAETSRGPAIAVADNGIGFPQEHAERIFLPFEKIVDPKDYPGAGVGLANVSRIVKRHGGRTWAEGRPGEGATFYFRLEP